MGEGILPAYRWQRTQEVSSFLYTLRPLNHLYDNTLAREFGPIAIKGVRELMIHGYDHPKFGPQEALSRNVINQRIKRIRRMFKWAVEQFIARGNREQAGGAPENSGSPAPQQTPGQAGDVFVRVALGPPRCQGSGHGWAAREVGGGADRRHVGQHPGRSR